MRGGNLVEALRTASDPSCENFPLTLVTLALVQHHLKDSSEATRWLQQVEDFYAVSVKRALADAAFVPATSWAYWNEFMILRREACEVITGQARPDDPWLLLLMGRERVKHGFAERANQDFQRAVDLRPDDADLWATRGRIYAELGMLDRVDGDFEKAARLTKTQEQSISLAKAAARSSTAAAAAGDVSRRDKFRRVAFDALRRALEGGFENRQALRDDAELKALYGLPEFIELLN